jgi:hypothetical protein
MIRRQMAVPQRHRDRLVTERLLHLLQRATTLHEPGRERVTQSWNRKLSMLAATSAVSQALRNEFHLHDPNT